VKRRKRLFSGIKESVSNGDMDLVFAPVGVLGTEGGGFQLLRRFIEALSGLKLLNRSHGADDLEHFFVHLMGILCEIIAGKKKFIDIAFGENPLIRGADSCIVFVDTG